MVVIYKHITFRYGIEWTEHVDSGTPFIATIVMTIRGSSHHIT